MKKILFTLLAASLIAGCATMEPVPQAMIDSENECFREVAKVQVANAARTSTIQIVEFKDERNYVMALAIEQLGRAAGPVQVSEFIPCTLTVQTYLRESGQNVRSVNSITSKAVGVLGVVGGIWVGGNALEGILGAAGATTNYTNSRVISDSGNNNSGNFSASSSGEGLGTGNSYLDGSGSQQSGQQPRGSQSRVEGDESPPYQESASGDNANNITPPVVEE